MTDYTDNRTPINKDSKDSTNKNKNIDRDSDCDYSYSDESFDSDFSNSSNSDVTNVTRRSQSSSSSSSSSSLESQANVVNTSTIKLNLPDDDNEIDVRGCKNYSVSSMLSSINSSERQRRINRRLNECHDRLHRKNMSFTNMQVMKIERDNQCLLNKIMSQHKPITDNKNLGFVNRLSSSAINRRKFQRKIEEENMMMLRKIQSAKPRVLTENYSRKF
ncbi:cilia- and flagella-associated protein 97 [Microplitis demolitor]|uniref:cilia- and flagella-associated protein 97 n=1 Tax=Microplitis demolitor TaxID=69319 RepID=UPI00235B6503|nr:cilia- and flagella-associated protein 97 [Microplitis demolitor]